MAEDGKRAEFGVWSREREGECVCVREREREREREMIMTPEPTREACHAADAVDAPVPPQCSVGRALSSKLRRLPLRLAGLAVHVVRLAARLVDLGLPAGGQRVQRREAGGRPLPPPLAAAGERAAMGMAERGTRDRAERCQRRRRRSEARQPDRQAEHGPQKQLVQVKTLVDTFCSQPWWTPV